jgi:hypothetical protein
MIGSAPRFPVFEDWEKMTEQEQDALLGRMEAAPPQEVVAVVGRHHCWECRRRLRHAFNHVLSERRT